MAKGKPSGARTYPSRRRRSGPSTAGIAAKALRQAERLRRHESRLVTLEVRVEILLDLVADLREELQVRGIIAPLPREQGGSAASQVSEDIQPLR